MNIPPSLRLAAALALATFPFAHTPAAQSPPDAPLAAPPLASLRTESRIARGPSSAARSFTLVVPAAEPEAAGSKSALVVLCGAPGDSARAFLDRSGWGRVAAEHGVLLAVVPAGPLEDGDVSRITDNVSATHPLLPGSVFAVGLDAPATAAALAAARAHPDRIAAAALFPDPALPVPPDGAATPDAAALGATASLYVRVSAEGRREASDALGRLGYTIDRRAKDRAEELRESEGGGESLLRAAPPGPGDAARVWSFFVRNARGHASLNVRVTGLRNDRGSVAVALFRGKDGFPADSDKAVAAKSAPIKDGVATIAFDGLPVPGHYAAVLLHDENDNEKMDTSFGFPAEGFGASNNPRPGFGPPSFGSARFRLTGEEPRDIEVKVIYLGGDNR